MRGCAQKDHRGWRSWRWAHSKRQDKFLRVALDGELYLQTFFAGQVCWEMEINKVKEVCSVRARAGGHDSGKSPGRGICQEGESTY